MMLREGTEASQEAGGFTQTPPDPYELLSGLQEVDTIRFHQLVTLAELLFDQRGEVGQLGDPEEEFLRFRAARSLSFGARDIASMSFDDEARHLEIRVNFFGLYGPSSPLPPFYTERIIEEDQTPSAVEDLMDLFNHRMIALLHVIWRKYRYYLRYENGGTDALSKRFLALCGFPVEDRDRIGQVGRSALLPHVGLLSLYSSSADVVATTISNFFGVEARIEEFVTRRVAIEEDARFQLGVTNTELGGDTILGVELDDDHGKYRVCLGMATFKDLERFLPHGARHQQLSELLSMINREPLEWDIEFDFEPDSIAVTGLGETRLGWTSWLQAHEPDYLESKVRVGALGAI